MPSHPIDAGLRQPRGSSSLDNGNLLFEGISSGNALDLLPLTGKGAFRLRPLPPEDRQSVIDAGQCRLRAIDGRLEFVERALVVEIASEERLLAGTGRLFKRFLRLGLLGRELITTLCQRGNRRFNFLHRGPTEELHHAVSVDHCTLICLCAGLGANHSACRFSWRRPRLFGGILRAVTSFGKRTSAPAIEDS